MKLATPHTEDGGLGCHCGHAVHDGDHITFHCPSHQEQRAILLQNRSSWIEQDEDFYLEAESSPFETTVEFLPYLFHCLTTP